MSYLQKYRVSSDDSESSCGEDEEVVIQITEPFPFEGPKGLKAAVATGPRPLTANFAEMVGLPREVRSSYIYTLYMYILISLNSYRGPS